LLHERLPRREEQELRREVRLASERLLSRGITSVQDATATNGVEEWELFHRLADSGDLGLRVFMMVGSEHWRECVGAKHSRTRLVEAADGEARMLRPYNVRLGPVKFMLDEASTDPAELSAGVAAARAAGHAVAFHAVSEAELAIAVEALRAAGSSRSALPDRIEHGAVIPDDMLDDLREVGVTVVGQPALVYERGDVYRGEYPPDLHGWLHRAGSLLRGGIPYATGSDAPVTEPSPGLALAALRRRQTRDGAVLGSGEALDTEQALAALTLWPARAVGVDDELGLLRVGQLADVVVLDEGTLDSADDEASRQQARFTVRDGRLVWKQAQT
jgi:predicted amidohydrolase YtcJ